MKVGAVIALSGLAYVAYRLLSRRRDGLGDVPRSGDAYSMICSSDAPIPNRAACVRVTASELTGYWERVLRGEAPPLSESECATIRTVGLAPEMVRGAGCPSIDGAPAPRLSTAQCLLHLQKGWSTRADLGYHGCDLTRMRYDPRRTTAAVCEGETFLASDIALPSAVCAAPLLPVCFSTRSNSVSCRDPTTGVSVPAGAYVSASPTGPSTTRASSPYQYQPGRLWL